MNTRARAEALADAAGIPPDEPEPREEEVGLDPRTVPRDRLLRGVFETAEQAKAAWAEPEPLEGSGPPPAPFPLETLPRRVHDFVTALAAMTQTPPDMAATTALGTLSVAAANRAWVSGGSGWVEPLVLWVIPVLPPASRKSAVTSAVAAPLYAIERQMRAIHAKENRGTEDALIIAEKRKDKLLKDAAVASTATRRQEIAADLDALAQEVDDLKPKPPPRLLVDDFTPEALSIILQNNKGRIGVITAEGGVFAAITGRYQKNAQPALDLLLKSYDGEPFRSDRVGRDPVTIDRPAAVLALCVQPHVLAETTKQPALRERGLMGRFAYAVPVDTVGTRSVDAPEMPGIVVKDWHELLAHILKIPVCGDDDILRTIHLDDDALELHRGFRATLEPRLHGETGDLAFMTDWAGKLAGRILRVAALLHLAKRQGHERPITFETMCAAVEIGEWMLTHAVAVYGGWRATEKNMAADRVLRWIKRTRPPGFTVKDAYEALRGQTWCDRSEDVKDALVVLAGAGWVTSVERFMSDGKRRLKEGTFLPHPDLLGEAS